ncbi:MAG: hypothetical protein IJ328_05480 [Muribaculaceae bacterium]|nr:hypothetical protein [Muribaculaceae bacterium]
MKKIYTILSIALCAVFSMQAQFSPIAGDFKAVKQKTTIKQAKQKSLSAKAVTTKAVAIDDICGTYSAYAFSAFEGEPDEEWTVEITKDETDANKVWIQPILSLVANGLPDAAVNPVYATLNADGTLSLPMGQIVFAQSPNYNLILGTSVTGETVDVTSLITMNVSEDGKIISFADNCYVGVGNTVGNQWWWQAVYNVRYTKENEAPEVNIYEKGNAEPTTVKADELYFNEVNGEMCVTTGKEYTTDKIAGTYNGYGMSAFEGEPDEEWTVKITRDADNPNKVWIHPVFMFGGLAAEDINPIYAMYDESANTLSIPLGQCLFGGVGQTYNIVLAWTVDGGVTINTTEELRYNLIDEGLIIEGGVFGAYNLNDGYWYQGFGYMEMINARGKAFPLSNIEKISRK